MILPTFGSWFGPGGFGQYGNSGIAGGFDPSKLPQMPPVPGQFGSTPMIPSNSMDPNAPVFEGRGPMGGPGAFGSLPGQALPPQQMAQRLAGIWGGMGRGPMPPMMPPGAFGRFFGPGGFGSNGNTGFTGGWAPNGHLSGWAPNGRPPGGVPVGPGGSFAARATF